MKVRLQIITFRNGPDFVLVCSSMGEGGPLPQRRFKDIRSLIAAIRKAGLPAEEPDIKKVRATKPYDLGEYDVTPEQLKALFPNN